MEIRIAYVLLCLLVSGQCGLIFAAEPGGRIVLSATTVDLDDKDCKEFALREPIWVRFTMENSSDVKATAALPGEPGYGVQIEPVTKDANLKSRAVEKREFTERIIRTRHFEPKAKETFEVLLADWVDINGEGTFKLEAKLRLLDEKGRPAQELKTEFSITIKGQLDKKGLDALMKRLEALYSSKRDALDRYRALDSVRAIRAPEVLPFLAKAVAEKSEITQGLAVQALSVLPYPEVIPLLKKAAESRFATVREAAQAELDRREKANPGPS
jgi:hypothetical protein